MPSILTLIFGDPVTTGSKKTKSRNDPSTENVIPCSSKPFIKVDMTLS